MSSPGWFPDGYFDDYWPDGYFPDYGAAVAGPVCIKSIEIESATAADIEIESAVNAVIQIGCNQ